MIFNKKLVIDGKQAYTMTANDIIIVRVKGQEEFKWKVPDNFQGAITININGELTEITPEDTSKIGISEKVA